MYFSFQKLFRLLMIVRQALNLVLPGATMQSLITVQEREDEQTCDPSGKPLKGNR